LVLVPVLTQLIISHAILEIFANSTPATRASFTHKAFLLTELDGRDDFQKEWKIQGLF